MKRQQPTEELIGIRALNLTSFRLAGPLEANSALPEGLEKGNSKTGESGRFYSRVFVWNIPPVFTCPGASEKCLQLCYNGDSRPGKFPIEKWQQNLWWFINQPDILHDKIQQQLDESSELTAVRIHSAGDFFSDSYVSFWEKIVTANQHVRFWAYTRSWSVERLHKNLYDLKILPNMQLFASVDESMTGWPKDWRLSILRTKKDLCYSKALVCPEQLSKVESCASCGFCIKNNPRSIIFDIH